MLHTSFDRSNVQREARARASAPLLQFWLWLPSQDDILARVLLEYGWLYCKKKNENIFFY